MDYATLLIDNLQRYNDKYAKGADLLSNPETVIGGIRFSDAVMESLHDPEHPQEHSLCFFIPTVRIIPEVYLWKYLDLIPILHLDQAHVIIHRNNVTYIPAVADLQELQCIRMFLITGKRMNEFLQVLKDRLRKVRIFCMEIRVAGNLIEFPYLQKCFHITDPCQLIYNSVVF